MQHPVWPAVWYGCCSSFRMVLVRLYHDEWSWARRVSRTNLPGGPSRGFSAAPASPSSPWLPCTTLYFPFYFSGSFSLFSMAEISSSTHPLNDCIPPCFKPSLLHIFFMSELMSFLMTSVTIYIVMSPESAGGVSWNPISHPHLGSSECHSWRCPTLSSSSPSFANIRGPSRVQSQPIASPSAHLSNILDLSLGSLSLSRQPSHLKDTTCELLHKYVYIISFLFPLLLPLC